MGYRSIATLAGRGSGPDQFTGTLRAVAVDGDGGFYLAGDSEVEVLDREGRLKARWATEKPGLSLAVGPEGRVWVGEVRQVEIFSATGEREDVWRDELLGLVTAIGFADGDVLLADARSRWIHRYGRNRRLINNIGDRLRKGGFHIPNGVVDFAVGGDGVVHVADPGMHRVERYQPSGELLGHFGHFDGRDPEGFPGCCNPTNVALAADGRVVVTEKGGPRVKVYDPEGRLLDVVAGGETFDPAAKNMDVAVDPEGRIAVIDTARLALHVFAEEVSAQ